MGHPNCYLSEPKDVIQFEKGQYYVKGSKGYVEVTVVRENAGDSFTTCYFHTKDITAEAGKDYTRQNSSLTFKDGEMEKVKIGVVESNHPLASQIGKTIINLPLGHHKGPSLGKCLILSFHATTY